ncbi:MAG: TRAP transporter small permease [Pseudomonadota bacterium]|nr:TRAP transporter small permease [Pseudomonadota bacterium]
MNTQRYRWLKLAERWGQRTENALLFVLLSGLILLACSQIFLRNIFSMGFPWTDGAIRLAVLWLGLVGGIAASRDRKQIAIDIVTRALPVKVKRITDIIAHVFTASVTGLLAWYSLRFVQDSYAFGDTLLSDWPAWIFQLILPIGFAMICFRYVLRALREFIGPDL